jgi:diguanylate cyclase (GGDEF)-like protein
MALVPTARSRLKVAMELQNDLAHHFAGTCTRLVLDHVSARAGSAAVAAVLGLAREARSESELREDTTWSSYAQFRALTEAAAAILGTVRCFDDMYDTVSMVEGTMPEATEMLQLLGSPGALYRASEHGNGVVTIMTNVGLLDEVAPTEWHCGYRLLPGFELWPEFCSFWHGMNSLTPKLFGLVVEDVTEIACARDGAGYCNYRIRWSDAGEESEVQRLRMRVGLLESRAEAFRETVTNLVSDDDLPTLLQRIVEAAARSTRAPAFVLTLNRLPWKTERVFSHGLDTDRARTFAQTLVSRNGQSDDTSFVVDVASKKRHYGWLAATDPFGSVTETDLPVLREYGRLAAAALDSATALEEARYQAASARALLALSSELAETTSVDQMASKIAVVTPMVVDCDLTAVVLIDDDHVARVKGASGFQPEVEHFIRQVEFPVDERLIQGFTLNTLDDASPNLRAVMEAAGALALATVPVRIDGSTAGSVVVGVRTNLDRLTDNPSLEDQLRGLAGQVSTALRNARLLEQIREQALHDALTGLPNRTLVLDRTEQILDRVRREGSSIAVLFIDLDGFKNVNDSLGHASGDLLLQGVAQRLRAAVRESDTVARFGGDEFVVLAPDGALEGGPELVAQRIIAALHSPFELDDLTTPLTIGASIGIAVGGRTTALELFRDADAALYAAKSGGKGQYVVFHPELHPAHRSNSALAAY